MVGMMFCVCMDDMYVWTMLFIDFFHDWDMNLCDRNLLEEYFLLMSKETIAHESSFQQVSICLLIPSC